MLQQIFSLSFMTAFLAAAVRLAVPLMYGGIGETIAEKSGILNIGMEGVMLSGAFFSFAGAWYSGNLFVGLLCGIDRKSTRLNSSHDRQSRMPSSA